MYDLYMTFNDFVLTTIMILTEPGQQRPAEGNHELFGGWDLIDNYVTMEKYSGHEIVWDYVRLCAIVTSN